MYSCLPTLLRCTSPPGKRIFGRRRGRASEPTFPLLPPLHRFPPTWEMKRPSKRIRSSCRDTPEPRGGPDVPLRSLASLDAETTRLKVGWTCRKLFCRGVTCSASSSVEKICEVNWAS
ncbi:hypothetical protein EYF80_015977 [Liparis tanakae]|uniref:Uncharacterized protein n=1 Tax=Liparis tanakae TaxID=230148 RepID=A0A4Z2I6S8_9TELE|nr:hypothetical protein EYF80_015977 [Liparis tanakae]